MTVSKTPARYGCGQPAERVVCPDSLGRALLDTAARSLRGHAAVDLARVPVLGRHGQSAGLTRSRRLAADARAEAVPVGDVDKIDAEAVARWVAGHYPAPVFPAVVLGSPHGAAVHLAALLGAPWLPTAFTVTVPWAGGSVGNWPGAMQWGAELAGRITANNPDVSVRQVHDPVLRGPLCAATVSLRVQWRRPPAAYRDLLRSRLAPDGAAVLVRDIRTWPVLERTAGYSFQAGTPAGGLDHSRYTMDDPSFRRLMHSFWCEQWSPRDAQIPLRGAETTGDPTFGPRLRSFLQGADRAFHRVLYPGPASLSACVADLYRDRTGAADCVAETGRLLDPWQALTRRLVPYWCESPSRAAVEAAEWWLAGSRPFGRVTVLPGPPGTAGDFHAKPGLWRSLAAFARRRGHVDALTLRRYPLPPSPTSHATSAFAAAGRPGAALPPLPVPEAMAALRNAGRPWEVMVS